MNAWLLAAAALLVGTIGPAIAVALHGPSHRRLVGADLAGTGMPVVFLLLAQGYSRTSYQDLALILAVLAPAGTLVFTRFLAGERG
ncbi:monovalent cation/H+ antiporter complex subunit F [Kitasatospora sp. RB6PN24]|uniref:monovalent cation/H+ antiporter complex subunit F n=1 Tax=Kitasatospora humi TaxID=2893891 RepID=UPI001E3E6D66|nr:monovalent cation/H+ antiporter complex subunit F [Kitasatospora humi]MCC9305774.1 monovalent cation/H+ antiporter complex subunit F [Kitasatospora humi]